MELKVYRGINDCARLWNHFTPNQHMFDSWDYRACFYDRQEAKPHFIVGRDKRKIVGVIPLAYSKKDNDYSYFGGWFPERNAFFFNDKSKLGNLLNECPDKTLIEGIDPKEAKYYNFSEDQYTYYIDLAKYGYNFEKYFNSFEKKKQKNFRSDLKKIPKYKVYYNRTRDFKRLVQLNIKQFEDDSVYKREWLKRGVKKMILAAQKKRTLQMISVEVNGKVEAVDVGFKHKNWYHVLTGSANNQKIPNIGKLMVVLDIQNAIAKKVRYVDFLSSCDHWKKQWGFDKQMLFKFQK
ncbi:MAG: GNAT family N-acetyltransferase [Nanoarchaeota archaeon]